MFSSPAGRLKICGDFPGLERVAYCEHRFAAPEALSHCLSAEEAPRKEKDHIANYVYSKSLPDRRRRRLPHSSCHLSPFLY